MAAKANHSNQDAPFKTKASKADSAPQLLCTGSRLPICSLLYELWLHALVVERGKPLAIGVAFHFLPKLCLLAGRVSCAEQLIPGRTLPCRYWRGFIFILATVANGVALSDDGYWIGMRLRFSGGFNSHATLC
jgi:hypothetical protein